jgi:hypothetical protein
MDAREKELINGIKEGVRKKIIPLDEALYRAFYLGKHSCTIKDIKKSKVQSETEVSEG